MIEPYLVLNFFNRLHSTNLFRFSNVKTLPRVDGNKFFMFSRRTLKPLPSGHAASRVNVGPYPWTSIVVDESWLTGHRDTTDRHLKCLIESIVTMKRNRADSERIIGKYMKITDPKLAATEFDFVTSLMPDYPTPTFDGIRLILENFGKEYPDAPRSKRVR